MIIERINQISLLIFFTFFLNIVSGKSNPHLDKNDKSALLEEVYSNMARAMGLGAARPEIVLDSDQSKYVAYVATRSGKRVIGVEEKAFNICLEYGERAKDALALLLGHELVHYTYGHSWGSDFSSAFALSDMAKDVDKAGKLLDSIPYWETQADHIGGFYCYLAGYNIIGLGDTLLRRIYKAYNLRDKPKYPDLNERIAISKKNEEEIRQLIFVFEAGNYSILLEKYSVARDFFMHLVSKNFGNREIFNNMGVSYVLEALSLMRPGELTYAYPVELELESRAKKLVTKGIKEEIEKLLNKSLEMFEEATQRDPEFATALVNIACVYSMLGDTRKAMFYAEEAIDLSKSNNQVGTFTNAQTVLGIAKMQSGEKKQAIKLLKNAAKKGSWLAGKNLEIINGKKLEEIDWEGRPVMLDIAERGQKIALSAMQTREKIEPIDLYNPYLELPFYGHEIGDNQFYFSNMDASTVIRIQVGPSESVFIQKTGDSYLGASLLGIKRKQLSGDVIKSYGIPTKVYHARQGLIYFYPAQKIAFFLNEFNQVDGWMIFRIEKL